MSTIPSIVSAHMPTVATVAQFAQSHIPLPMLTLYAALTSLQSLIPPAAGLTAVAWITISQVMSVLRLSKNPPLPPIAFIRGCVSSFIGLYVVTLLIMIPIRTNQIAHYLATPPDASALSHYFPPENVKHFKESLLTHEPTSTHSEPKQPAPPATQNTPTAPTAHDKTAPAATNTTTPPASDQPADTNNTSPEHSWLQGFLSHLIGLQHSQQPDTTH